MDPNPKSTKTLDDDNPTGIDRISNLPDEILCHILSFLPTKYAVGTSILSTRWKNLFPYIPNLSLDFDDSLLLHPHHQENPNLIPDFVVFVYNVLKNASRIYSFSLRCQRDYEVVDCEKGYKNSDITLWVYWALLYKNVRELTVEIDKRDGDFILFPLRIFYCSSVMWVTIRGRFLFDFPTFFYMPNLTSIFLDRVKFRNGEVVQSLIRGCLSLEEFHLERCEFEELEVLEISSTELKHLVIINCKWDGEYEVVLDVPNLEVLHYQADAIAYDYIVKNLGCLREAHIDIDFNWELVEDNSPHYEDTAIGFVAACLNLETLYLSQNSLHAIRLSWEFIRPTFCNLTTLKLDIIDYRGWPFLPSLLKSCPNLEVLEFTLGFTDYEDFPLFVSCLAEHEPQCLSSHLQKVKIQHFTGDEDELNVVEFFLKNAKVLREVEINSVLSSEEQLNISKKLSLFPKCSAACEIVFTSSEV